MDEVRKDHFEWGNTHTHTHTQAQTQAHSDTKLKLIDTRKEKKNKLNFKLPERNGKHYGKINKIKYA